VAPASEGRRSVCVRERWGAGVRAGKGVGGERERERKREREKREVARERGEKGMDRASASYTTREHILYH